MGPRLKSHETLKLFEWIEALVLLCVGGRTHRPWPCPNSSSTRFGAQHQSVVAPYMSLCKELTLHVSVEIRIEIRIEIRNEIRIEIRIVINSF